MGKSNTIPFFLTPLILGFALADDLDLPIGDPKKAPPRRVEIEIPPPPTQIKPPITNGPIVIDGPILPPAPVIDDPRDHPPPHIYGEELYDVQDSIVYVLDVSGSMNQTVEPWVGSDGVPINGTRADRAKDEFAKSVYGLAPNLKFSLIVYSCVVYEVPQGLVEASPENKAKAISWLRNAVRVEGGTATGAGVMTGLRYKDNSYVVLMTDGEPGCGFDSEGNLAMRIETHLNQIRTANTQKARIDVFAINPPSTATRDFCRRIASDHGGRAFEIR